LKAVLRESDRICRLGGDEFAILIPYAPEGVDWDETVCERVLRALREPFRYGNEVVCPAATIGAVRCPQDAIEIEALYKCADSALYAAKNAGRDTWRWYSQLMDEAPTCEI
jgi:diguanylate cyclase (GGDEF)-like protein